MTETPAYDTDIHPFEIAIPDRELEDLRRRLADSRLPQPVSGIGWERGVPLDYLEGLVVDWRDGVDWRASERRLNASPQSVTIRRESGRALGKLPPASVRTGQ